MDLPPIQRVKSNNTEINPFEISGVLKDYVEMQEEINNIKSKSTYEQVIEFLENHDGQLMKGAFTKNGKNLRKKEMTLEQREETTLYARWRQAPERRILEEYVGQPIENVPEEYRSKIEKLRSFGLGIEEKTTYEQVIEFLETHDGNLMRDTFVKSKRKKFTKKFKQKRNDTRATKRSKIV